MNRRVGDLFSDLEEIDPSLKIKPQMLGRLARRQIRPQAYSQATLFSSMALGKPVLFDQYPSPLKKSGPVQPVRQVEAALTRLGHRNRFEVRCGPSETSKYLTGRELVERWNSSRARVNVTDLHIRGTSIEQLVDPRNLSWFNLLPDCGEEAATQEMMSLVVSSRGCLSDSHSDAPDSSNYCFAGEKVWLFWDTFEGKKLGLEDCSIDTVLSHCSFDMARFLSLRSARWLTVSDGQALFLPGEYTHKVITTRRYMGVGSFYLSLPNSLRSLSRWNLHGPLWLENRSNAEDDPALAEIAQQLNHTIKKMRSRSNRFQEKLGYNYLQHAFDSWRKSTRKRQQKVVLSSSNFSSYMELLRKVQAIY